MTKQRRVFFYFSLLVCGAALLQIAPGSLSGQNAVDGRPVAVLLEIDGSINPALADYIIKGIRSAEDMGAACVIIRLDTPGGVVTTTKLIIKEMSNAKVPVAVYVGPSGSSATSAGAFITLAADVAAMAPGTNIGAAHPVAGGGQEIGQVMSEKVVNDLTAYMRGIVTRKGRNAEWAERAIRESVSITAKEALEMKAIDLVAESVPDLLDKMDGRTVEKSGGTLTLKTKGARLEKIAPGWRFKILDAVANPNIAFILFMIGLAGIGMELSHPGLIFPGAVGGICLLLFLFASQILPVSFVGLALILLAVVLFILEVKIASFGLLALGGILCLALGAVMLFDTEESAMRVSLSVLIPTVIGTAAFFTILVGVVLRAHLKKARTGMAGLVGEVGVALTDLDMEGKVAVHGEYWNSRADGFIPKGERVRVTRIDGLKVIVTRNLSG